MLLINESEEISHFHLFYLATGNYKKLRLGMYLLSIFFLIKYLM